MMESRYIRKSTVEACKRLIESAVGFQGFHGSVQFNLCDGHVAGANVTEHIVYPKPEKGKR